MKKIALVLSMAFASITGLHAQNWTLDKAHSSVGFIVTHLLISEIDGGFKSYDAKITSNKSDFSDAVIEFSADAASINTGMEMRDDHLQGADFFDTAKHKSVTFKSTSVKKVKGENYVIKGNLTIKGVTKSVVLNTIIKGPVENPRSKQPTIGIKATGKINRAAFGVGTAGGAVSDDVELKISGEFSKG